MCEGRRNAPNLVVVLTIRTLSKVCNVRQVLKGVGLEVRVSVYLIAVTKYSSGNIRHLVEKPRACHSKNGLNLLMLIRSVNVPCCTVCVYLCYCERPIML